MTTDESQTRLISDAELAQNLEASVEIRLSILQAWTKLPNERTDWELETILDELGTAALALRRLRGDGDVPF